VLAFVVTIELKLGPLPIIHASHVIEALNQEVKDDVLRKLLLWQRLFHYCDSVCPSSLMAVDLVAHFCVMILGAFYVVTPMKQYRACASASRFEQIVVDGNTIGVHDLSV
jgi:hypothetical protein